MHAQQATASPPPWSWGASQPCSSLMMPMLRRLWSGVWWVLACRLPHPWHAPLICTCSPLALLEICVAGWHASCASSWQCMTSLFDLSGLCHACVVDSLPQNNTLCMPSHSAHQQCCVYGRPNSGVSPRQEGATHTAHKHMQFGVFWTNGQICSSTSRLLVQEGIAPAFYEQLKKRAESIKQCDPLTEDCRMGPVVNQDQYDKIMGFIQVMPVSTRQQLLSCEAAYLAKHAFTVPCLSELDLKDARQEGS